MTMLNAAVFSAAGLGFAVATVFAVVFYRDFFASDTQPREWYVMYAGIGLLSASMFSRALLAFLGAGDSLYILVADLLAMSLLLVSSFMMWNKFRL